MCRGRDARTPAPRSPWLRHTTGSIEAYVLLLLRGRQSLRARELAQLVVRRRHLPIRTNRGEGFEQRFRIHDRDPILEDARRREPDALAHGELIAVRRERIEQRVLANGHGVHDERVPFPMPGGIAGERRIVEDSLRRLAAVEINPAIHVVQLAVHGDRKSTRLNSSHSQISYAVFCLKKKKKKKIKKNTNK